MSKFRLAIIGAGPAGIYAADLILKAERDFDVSIDLFDLLPAPYGLVRYGVAPDHPRIKGIIKALYEVLDRGDIRFFGNVKYGQDLDLEDLKKHYNAVIFATGAIKDAPLNIPGVELEGSYGAADFVNWYDSHPDFPFTWPLDAKEVAVIDDGLAGFVGALGGRNGVVLSVGGGVVSIGGIDGHYAHRDGLGNTFGDEGSGFWIIEKDRTRQ